jgi:hypothetical protein
MNDDTLQINAQLLNGPCSVFNGYQYFRDSAFVRRILQAGARARQMPTIQQYHTSICRGVSQLATNKLTEAN